MGNLGGDSGNADSSRISEHLALVIQELKCVIPTRDAINDPLPTRIAINHPLPTRDFKTTMATADRIMDALKDDTINIIGISGLAGVGKTHNLVGVRERVRTEMLFDMSVMTFVSQETNLYRIQGDLAGMLGLKLNDEDDIIKRASSLHQRLKSAGRILVILDDLWSEIRLEDIGIPIGNSCSTCKVIIASRNESVCTAMGSQTIIRVEVLLQEEGWHLFKAVAGDCVDREDLVKIAKEVASECRGLPLALIVLARALSNKRKEVWEDACRQLRKTSLAGIPEMDKNVSSSIMISYNYLAYDKGSKAQQLFLICCQHPSNAKINVDKLACYCLALHLFQGVDRLADAQYITYAIIDELRACSLLVFNDNEESKYETVQVFDNVRRACLLNVSEENEERDEVYMHVMAQDTNGGSNVNYPKLKLLMEAPLDGGLLDTSFLERMGELRVFENLEGDEHHLPPALEVLKNVRMLSLERTSLNEKLMSSIGSLSKLEILSFWCSKISSFPHEIRQLSYLKLLDLRCAEGRGRIPRGILPGLKKLEVLCMGEFMLLGLAEDKDNQDVENYGTITELGSLSNLTNLQINLVDHKDLLDIPRFHLENLKYFCLGTYTSIDIQYTSTRMRTSVWNALNLGNFIGMKWVLEAKIQFIVKSTVDLELRDIEDWNNPLILEKFVSLKKLVLKSCKQLKYVIPEGFQGKLRVLNLKNMPAMRDLWVCSIDPLCLLNLREVKIEECHVIQCVFSFSTAKCLMQLQELTINNCRKMEEIFSRSEIPNDPLNSFIVLLPKVRILELEYLPNFGGFYHLNSGNGMILSLSNPAVMLSNLMKLRCVSMPLIKQIVGGRMPELSEPISFNWMQELEEVTVSQCDSLETVFDFEGLQIVGENVHVGILRELKYVTLSELPKLKRFCGLFPKETNAFQNLAALAVYDCDNLGYLLSSFMAELLVNLEILIVERCKSMKEVIQMHEDLGAKKIMFRSLRIITLANLKNLSSFCSDYWLSFEFPSLEEMFINNCPVMKTFSGRNLNAEKLQGVKLSDRDDKLIWKGDLNKTVQYLYARVNKMKKNVRKDGVREAAISDKGTNEVTKSNASLSFPSASLIPDVLKPSAPVLDNNEELANLSSSDTRRVTFPPLIEFAPSTSMQQAVQSSDSPLQPKDDKELSIMSINSRDDDWKRSSILIRGVYVQAELKTTFEDILTARPNFLSRLRLKTVRMKTDVVESAIISFQILRQRTALTISSEELAYIKDSLDDLENSGLETDWLERGYQRAKLLTNEVSFAIAELAMSEREERENQAAFEMARAKLEASMARRVASQAKYDAIMQELEVGKELFGGDFDLETYLGDGLLDSSKVVRKPSDIKCTVYTKKPLDIKCTVDTKKLSYVECTINTKIQFIDLLPAEYHHVIVETTNVRGDGHCGFRVVAALLGFTENEWARVRKDLKHELVEHGDLYNEVFLEKHGDRVKKILKSIDYYGRIATKDYWFECPYMAQLVTSHYNVALVVVDRTISLTYLPLRTEIPTNPKLICIGLIDNSHYIQVFLEANCVLPPVFCHWFKHRKMEASGWFNLFQNRMDMFSTSIGTSSSVETRVIE